MTTPPRRWELSRQQWAQPASTILVVRRALGRARYNRRRQKLAWDRRRMLATLLRQNGFDPAGDLRGAGNRGLYRQYHAECGRSYRTFLRDLAYFRLNGRLGLRALQATAWPSTSPHQSVAPKPSPTLTPPAPPLSPDPCPTCGRARGMPARSPASTPPSPWYVISLALFRALTEMLPAPMEEAVFERARHHLARLRLPRRLWAAVQSVASAPKPAPPPPPPAQAPDGWADAREWAPVPEGADGPAGPTTTMLLRAWYGTAPPVPEGMRSRGPDAPDARSPRPPLPPRRPSPPPRDPTDWW